MLNDKLQTISAEELLRYCDYDTEQMSKAAIRVQAMRTRARYGLTGIQGPRRGLRYSLAEVKRKIQFTKVPPSTKQHPDANA